MGKIFRFDRDVDTDQIIASQYLLYPTIDEMKEHTFESLDADFAKNVKPGDFVVAEENFGCGSSREQAPSVLKALGVKAVLAKSFARIFYRNCINIGLPAIVCRDLWDEVKSGDEMELSLSDGTVHVGSSLLRGPHHVIDGGFIHYFEPHKAVVAHVCQYLIYSGCGPYLIPSLLGEVVEFSSVLDKLVHFRLLSVK